MVACPVISLSGPLHGQGPGALVDYKIPVVQLTGRAIGDPNILARPTQIAWVTGKLVIIDRGADSMVVVLDAATGHTIRRFGRRGGGPGEFMGSSVPKLV